MRYRSLYLTILLVVASVTGNAQDSLRFKGQFSAYTHVNSENKLPWWSGARYIPQLNYEYRLPNEKLIDFEASSNIYGNAGLKSFESDSLSGDLKPYRLWARLSAEQFEIRAGLQKIDFGSASLLRPLMWFDQVDPRDPLRLTDGVWGILGRYYFFNNANIWLWGLYGNNDPKGWEIMPTAKGKPEFGGRFQFPVPQGEAAFTYHYRCADNKVVEGFDNYVGRIPENRFAFDMKLDVVIGLWLEAVWVNERKNLGMFTNQEIINLGMDCTFGIGNGLTASWEQLLTSYDEKPLRFENTVTFSSVNLTYPVGLFDNLSAIIYYDWTNKTAYNFVTWKKQFNRISIYLMGYVNPEKYDVPTQGTGEMLFAGSGVQLMLVFNH